MRSFRILLFSTLVLDPMSLFFQRRQLSLAPEKCEKLTLGKKPVVSDFTIDNTLLTEVDVVKDLGIHISAKT